MNKLKQFKKCIQEHHLEIQQHFVERYKDFRVKPSPSKFGITLYNSIEFVPQKIWDLLNVKNDIFLSPAYLRAIETAPPQEMKLKYVILYDGKRPVAIASFQIITVKVSRYGPKWTKIVVDNIKDKISSIIYRVKDKHSIRLIVCGNLLVSGENAFSCLPDVNPEEIFHGLAEAAYKIQEVEKRSNNINSVLIKDFYQRENNPADKLKDFGFHRFSAGPNMVVQIQEERDSFDDYISVMTGKYRSKARSAIRKGTELKRKDLTVDEISKHRETIYDLYIQVHNRSNFRIITFNPRNFEELKVQLGNHFSLEAYFLEDRMVGFTTRIYNGKVMEGYAHGISYEHNKKLALYQNILYDDIRVGIAKQVKQINYGRTSIAMKSSVGAVPRDMLCYLRLNSPISNHLINPLFHLINPEEEYVRNPFGKKIVN